VRRAAAVGEQSANGNAPNLSGPELLDEISRFIRRFVALSYVQSVMVALWVLHTHAFDAADCTPYVSITSAEKRSGKTRLLEVLDLLVVRPWFTGRVSAAVLVRKTANEQPTLLLDESDAAFKGDKEYAEALRGILNAGFRRGGVTSLCVGQGANLSYRDFPVFGPKAIAGIGKLPDTIADRSIPVELKRRAPGEHVERFRQRKVEAEAVALYSASAAWAEANVRALKEAEPELPEELDDRAQDIVEPLLAIADAADGGWPKRARDAAVALLTGEHREDSESLGVRLLRDIRDVFDEETDRMRTTDILTALNKRGEALDARGLARFLKAYGIRPGQVWIDGTNPQGYKRGDFHDAWARYVPDDIGREDPERGPAGSGKSPRCPRSPRVDENPPKQADIGLGDDANLEETPRDALGENPHEQRDLGHLGDLGDNPEGRGEKPSSWASDLVRCIHDFPGGEGCYVCDPEHPYRRREREEGA
jgi:hypothetical protein